MRLSGRTTRAVEEYKRLLKSGEHVVFIAANLIECRRITELLGDSKNVYSISHHNFNRDTGNIHGISRNINHISIFDHYACECIIQDIEDEVSRLRKLQNKYRDLSVKY